MPVPTVAAVVRLRPALGTFVAFACRAEAHRDATDAIESAYAAVALVDRLMHPKRAGSDLATIADAPAGRCSDVHPWTWEVLRLSQRLHASSHGLFDPCLPDAPGRMIDVDLPAQNVVVCAKRVAIDLGGIAKGFAVDQAVHALRDAGCIEGDVNAGGDARVFGPSPRTLRLRATGGDWPITLHERACASSRWDATDRPSEHRGYYDHTRGQTETAVRSGQTAVVTASTAAAADALTKCVLLRGPNDACVRALLLEFDAAVAWFGPS